MPGSVQDDPSIYYDECCLIVTLRHTRALLTANALLTSSAANQMSRKTTSRNVNNAICGQPRGSIGACACRPLQLCLPLPLSVRPFLSLSLSVSRSLNRRLFVYFCCRWRSTSSSFYFVSPRCPITFAERNICCCRKSSSLVRGKKTTPWSVISVTQSPRSMKIMMNVRGKTVSYLLGYEIWNLPAGKLTP